MSVRTLYDVAVTVPFTAVSALFCGAFEGGSNYWLHSADLVSCTIAPKKGLVWWGTDEVFSSDYTFKLGFDDPDEEGKIKEKTFSRQDVIDALHIMARRYPTAFGDVLAHDFDAEVADIFMQCLALGDVVYG